MHRHFGPGAPAATHVATTEVDASGARVALKVIRETEVAGDESAPHVAEAIGFRRADGA